MTDSGFAVSDRTRMRRKAKRATYDRATIYAILDEALIAAVAVVLDGRPQVQPMIHMRDGDRLIFHGLAGNRLLSALAGGAEACVNVTLLDALALARRIEDHSMHYRSATIYGRGSEITDMADKQRLMEDVFGSLVRSERLTSLPPLDLAYLSGTMVVAVPIEEAVGKVNDAVDTGVGGTDGIWSGHVAVALRFAAPQADSRTLAEGLQPPADVLNYRRGP